MGVDIGVYRATTGHFWTNRNEMKHGNEKKKK
jgi:hypothetical protein